MPPAGFGAVEKVWCELGRAFAAKGHHITIVGRGERTTTRASQPNGLRVMALRGFDATGRIGLDLAKDLFYALSVVPRLPRSDIVVTNTFWAPVVLTPLQRSKGRIVVHVARFPKGHMWLYSGAHLLQAISSSVGDAIVEEAPGLADKVRVLGYPINLETFAPKQHSQARSEHPLVLYAGRVHPEKGVHLLVDAFRRVTEKVPNACLQVVGPVAERQGGGGEMYLRTLKAAAAGLNASFGNPVSDERELAALYRRADCFCYPSVAENGEALGRGVLEAMASGTACVVSGLECFGDFVEPGRNALVFEHRSTNAVSRLADLIASVLCDRDYAARLGRAGRVTAERYSLSRVAADYLRLFEATLHA